MNYGRQFDQQSREFWQWFSENAGRFAGVKPDTSDWTELDGAIRRLAIPSWEVGPTADGGWFLALSPGGDLQQLDLTRTVARKAPRIHGWTFLGSRPPKSWDRIFRWSSRLVSVNARNWRFAVFRYSDNMYEIVLLGPITPYSDSDELLQLASFVVEAELGEEFLLESVSIIDVENNPSDDMLDSAVLISDLRETISHRESTLGQPLCLRGERSGQWA